MKQVINKTKKKLILSILFVISSYVFLPNLHHYILLRRTSEKTIRKNKELYNKLALSLNKDSYKSNKNVSMRKRDSLYLWFHIRGLPIDEDHYSTTKLEEWKEMISYNINNKR